MNNLLTNLHDVNLHNSINSSNELILNRFFIYNDHTIDNLFLNNFFYQKNIYKIFYHNNQLSYTIFSNLSLLPGDNKEVFNNFVLSEKLNFNTFFIFGSITSNNDIPPSNNDIPPSNNDIPPSNNDIPPSNNILLANDTDFKLFLFFDNFQNLFFIDFSSFNIFDIFFDKFSIHIKLLVYPQLFLTSYNHNFNGF